MVHIPNVGPEVGHPVPPGQRPGDQLRPPADPDADLPADSPADPGGSGPIGGGDPGDPDADDGYPAGPPDVYSPPSGFTPSESIFGWSWLGQWAENAPNAHPKAAEFLQEWVDKFNKAAEEELSGAVTGTRTDVVVNNFLVALAQQSWWAEKTALWQSVQKLKYGTGTPRGEYDSLVQSYRDYVGDAARRLGLVDTNGNLTFDINGAAITELIEGVDGLILNAGVVGGNGLPAPDPMAVNRLLDKHFLTERTFDTIEGGTPGYRGAVFGPGALQDSYNWIKGLASNNYITLADEEIWDMVFRLKREEITPQGVWDRISGQVGDQYSFLDGTNIMNRINQFSANEEGSNWGGASSLKNHLEPVRQTIANTWELSLDEVNLGNIFGSSLEDLIKEDEEGNATTFMNSLEARRWARSQDRWKDTKAYKTGMGNNVSSILGLFGAR